MPINIQHAMIFSIVFVLCVLVTAFTIYVLLINIITDTYRYEKTLEKANEKVRVAGLLADGVLYYGVRNLGVTTVKIRELGIIDINGNRRVLVSNVELMPGQTYKSVSLSVYGAVYALTERGNVFSAPVIDMGKYVGEAKVSLKSLLPAVYQVSSPVKYSEDAEYTISLNTYAYVFGFLMAGDGHENILLSFGPHSVSQIFKDAYRTNSPVSLVQTKSGGTLMSATATLHFEVLSSDSEGVPPYYKLVLPLSVNTSNNALAVRGCVGVIWRMLAKNVYGLSLETSTPSVCSYGSGFKVCDEIQATLLPGTESLESVIAVLSRPTQPPRVVTAPSGSEIQVVLAHCFLVEGTGINSLTTTYETPYTSVFNSRINTVLKFPGTNYFGFSTTEIIGLTLKMNVETDYLLSSILGEV